MNARHWTGDHDADTDRYESRGGPRYRCLDCTWHGRGGVGASVHHREQGHHRIALGPAVQVFACCHNISDRRTA